MSEPASELTDSRTSLGTVSNNFYGYFAGGNSPSIVSIIDRLDFSNETIVASSNNLTRAQSYLSGVSN